MSTSLMFRNTSKKKQNNHGRAAMKSCTSISMEDLKPRPANSSPLTPLGFLERAAIIYDSCPSIIYDSTTYTWSETHRRCLQLASSLSFSGIQRGHVVSVIAPNTPAMYELHFAVPMAGAVLNTINLCLDSRTISILLCHSESKLIFVDQAYCALISDALALFPPETKRPLLVLIEDDAATEESSSSPVLNREDFVDSYEEMVRKGDSEFQWIQPASEWDPIVLNYTSGTTSSPKGVVHCHRGIFTVTLGSLFEWGVSKKSVYLWTLPMFHANGWCFPWGIAAVGGTNVCIRKFDAALIFALIRRHHVTHMCGAPVVLNMLTNSRDNRSLDRPVKILTGGAPPPATVLFQTESLGFDVSHAYGLTETGGAVIFCLWKQQWNQLPIKERARLKARQGVRMVAMTADVVDPKTGKSLKRDGVSIGEIVLRGGSIMLGYLKDLEATRKSMTDEGWFFTGDVGVMHPDGYLEIKDRSKDVIISGGENMSSVEVESVLYTNSVVNETAVVARPDEVWGETPCAFVSLRDGLSRKPTEEEIIEYCRGKLPRFLVPKTVVFMTELPKTSTGKIQKYVLREMAKSMGPTWSRL